jgi:hypothetical protein
MEEFATPIPPIGEIVITNRKAHGVFHVIVIPHAHPDEWFFKQFPLREMIDEYALANNLSIRQEEQADAED